MASRAKLSASLAVGSHFAYVTALFCCRKLCMKCSRTGMGSNGVMSMHTVGTGSAIHDELRVAQMAGTHEYRRISKGEQKDASKAWLSGVGLQGRSLHAKGHP
eukprot:1158728-Pelagomonas_calceolata.AAC.1